MLKKISSVLSLVLIIAIGYPRENLKSMQNIPGSYILNEIREDISYYHHSINANPENHLIQDEFMIDTSIVYVPAHNAQISPAIAFDGTNYFIVWRDQRNGSIDLYGARINQTGEILDPRGIVVLTSGGSNSSVAFGDSTYLVVCQDWFNSNWNISGVLVNQSGVVLDTNIISNAAHHQRYPSVAFDNTNFFVVWSDGRSGYYQIYGARVTQNGSILDTAGILISPIVDTQRYPSVTFDGTNYFVVWESRFMDNYDIYGVRVNQAGVVLDTAGIAISTAIDNQRHPSVAFDGTNYFTVWEDSRNDANDIYGARVNQDGIVLDSSGIAISTEVNEQASPSICFDRTNYLVVWIDSRYGPFDIYGSRVSQAGVILDTAGIALSSADNEQESPMLCFDGTNFLTVWQDKRNDSYDIYGSRINQSGNILDTSGIAVSTEVNDQHFPSISFDGNNYLVVWGDWRKGNYDIYGIRIDQTGLVIDTNSLAITTEANNQESPSLTFGETNYFAVWQDFRSDSYYDIYGSRVNQAGLVLDTSGIAICTAADHQRYPSTAFDGTNYLVVWDDERDRRTSHSDIYGARVSQAGVVLDLDGIPISTETDWQQSSSVAFDGTNYLVVWQDRRSGWDTDIYGARINQAGVVLDSTGFPISNAPYNQCSPWIAFDGSNYFVVWRDCRHGYSSIYGARVTQSGIILDSSGIAISPQVGFHYQPKVTFNDTNYLVVWEKEWNGYDIHGAHVTSSGLVYDTFQVATQVGDQQSPAISHGFGNQTLIAYSGWTETIQSRIYNTYRIWGKFAPLPGIEEQKNRSHLNSVLLSNSPNPFRKTTRIKYSMTKNGNLSLKIYDIGGRLVRNLLEGFQKSGVYSVNWNSSDDFGRKQSAGVYFYRLEKEEGPAITKELILLR